MDDFNEEALERAAEELRDFSSRGLDHVRVARGAVRREIDVVVNERIDHGVLAGRVLDRHLEQLIQIELDLSRAEGELAE